MSDSDTWGVGWGGDNSNRCCLNIRRVAVYVRTYVCMYIPMCECMTGRDRVGGTFGRGSCVCRNVLEHGHTCSVSLTLCCIANKLHKQYKSADYN